MEERNSLDPRTEKREREEEKKIKELLGDLPDFVKAYAASIRHLKPCTVLTYVKDLRAFLFYLIGSDEKLSGTPVKEFPLYVLTDQTEESLLSYLTSLTVNGKEAKKTYKRRKATSLSAFYSYLLKEHAIRENPAADISFARTVTLSSPAEEREVKRVIEGIRKNDKYLYAKKFPNGKEEVSVRRMSKKGEKIRERTVLRNVLIFTLFLETPLTPSEMTMLDMDDVDLQANILRIYGKEIEIEMVPAVRRALLRYLKGEKIPEALIKRQTVPAASDMIAFCKEHIEDPQLVKKAVSRFGRSDKQFVSDIGALARILRQGRDAFRPSESETALLLSGRGTRISDRTVRHIIRELSMTYLPADAAASVLSPTAIRKIREMRVISETEDAEELSDAMAIREPWAKMKVSAYRKQNQVL